MTTVTVPPAAPASPPRPPRPAAAPAVAVRPKGRLEWPLLLAWLREDGLISADDAERVTARFRAGASACTRWCAWVALA